MVRSSSPRRRASLVAGAGLCLSVVAGHAAETDSPGQVATVVPAYRQANHVAVLTIEGAIDRMTLRSLERRIAEARASSRFAV